MLRPSRIAAALEAHLVDVFVADGARGAGWSPRLTRAIESAVAERGAARAESGVDMLRTPHARDLLDRLTRAGWWADRVSLIHPIASAPPPALASEDR